MVRKQPCVGYGKAADGDGHSRFIGVKEGGVIFEGVEFPALFRVTAVTEQSLPMGECDMRVLPVFNVLVVDKSARQPEFPVRCLVNLEIGIIPFVVPFVVEAAGFLPYSVPVGQFYKESVSHRGPNKALRVGVQGAYRPSVMPDLGSVMPDLIGHHRQPFRSANP